MIITVRQLNAIHYYYFSMGIFSIVNAVFMGFGSLFSLVFIAFYCINSAIAWYLAIVVRKRMKDYVVVQSFGFAIRHVLVTLVTVGITIGVWISGVIPDTGLLSMLMFANYMVMFLAGIWYVMTRTGLAKELFQIYDERILQKSKEFMVRTRKAYHNFFGRQLVTDREILEYRFGSIKEVDDNFISAWKNRKSVRYVLECMARIELSLGRRALEVLKSKLYDLKVLPQGNDRLISQTEREYAAEERDITEYEKEFYKKSGETGSI